ncbi:hypothetical protein PRIPAC_94041 [Pristionchus pacificus]|uniref:Ribosomal protein n=1 Tax=Pristionchus pacificus TaxID=54126 RepID=A0A2A6CI58_PRIPA|nr:hypothetical protein PRIPAC_94041 [Pristionchus pacificus]|eukprot:PDM77767.1 ribosomal protein [Pristionchus pacificus]
MADEWAANEVNEAVDVAPAFELESDLPEVKLFGKWNRQEVNVADISLVSYITVKEQAKRFRKAPCPIGERLAWSLMMPGRSNAHECPHRQALFRDHPPPYWRGYAAAAFRNIKTIAECLADELINAAKESPNSYAIKKKDELERVAKFNGYAIDCIPNHQAGDCDPIAMFVQGRPIESTDGAPTTTDAAEAPVAQPVDPAPEPVPEPIENDGDVNIEEKETVNATGENEEKWNDMGTGVIADMP